ncbi:Sugar (pentulose and hexulose) kinase (plasmid) [Rubrobacter radiotolerans]|uniref:FGGY-family carbohydrate kinase n=1 Tax=Rubrobacter radiotolerans TaxID=42256 RepID=A0A023X8B5_RUBRA|nr:FGGY-family carbohydrate kinase [Rubrobacter radiotolerans]AHY48309.1 Sugar (pentulose and hexulose) kinase [Rubrobacter radiotolerans]MDX5895582.1 FGGY-family carbohydrate kinase [Rubrobacter radiotolerans]SMC01506.1 L-xylulokinase [Rubrobacter radiotolerans DSM 5868]
MSPYLLGLDSGNTGTKAVVFDEEGYERGVGSVGNTQINPYPRWVEQDMNGVWKNAVEAIRGAILAAKIDGREVSAIGVSGHGDGVYLVDGAGEPVRAGIQSMDSRAHRLLARWNESGLGDRVLRFNGQRPFAALPPVLLAWFKEEQPDVLERTERVLYVKDWLRYRLTGEYATDPSEASSGFTDVRTQGYSDEAYELYDLPEVRGMLPPVAASTEVVGGVTEEAARLTGLKAGTPVVGGAHDVDCASVGVGCVEPGDMTLIAGTWSINEVVGAEPAFVEGSACRNFVKPGLYLNMSASPTSATNLEWFVKRMCPLEYKTSRDMGISPFAFVNEEVKGVMNDESRVFYHPFIYSSPHGDDATGGFYGLRGWHTRGHLLRALFEGVAFNHKTHVEILRDAFEVKRVRLTGGGSTSRTWAQIFADTLNETVEVMGAGETSALGAALCAGVGTGVYGSVDDATDNVVRTFRIHEPDPRNSERLAEAYETHLSLVGAMSPVWERTG